MSEPAEKEEQEDDDVREETPSEPEPEPEPTPDEQEWLRMWCEGCQRDYRVSADKAGMRAKCRRCGTWIVVEERS